jgi:hypothetical protein
MSPLVRATSVDWTITIVVPIAVSIIPVISLTRPCACTAVARLQSSQLCAHGFLLPYLLDLDTSFCPLFPVAPTSSALRISGSIRGSVKVACPTEHSVRTASATVTPATIRPLDILGVGGPPKGTDPESSSKMCSPVASSAEDRTLDLDGCDDV